MRLTVLAVVVVGAGCGVGTSSDVTADPLATVGTDQAATMTIGEVLRGDERFSRFADVARRTMTPIAPSWLDLWDWDAARMGRDHDGVTVFVPTDAAFEALDPAVLAVLEDPDVDNDLLYSFLGHHYVHRLYASDDFEPGPQSTWRQSVSGPVELTVVPLTWGGHAIDQPDLRAANGYIHVISGVVIPDEITTAARS